MTLPRTWGIDGTVYAETGDRVAQRVLDFADADVDPEAIAANALVRVPLGRLLGSIALSWQSVIAAAVLVAVIVLGATLELGFIFGLIPLVVVMFGVIFTQFNRGFNFTLSRSHDAVRTGAGLTATLTETIPFGRIHAIEVRQPLLWRPAKWWQMRITMAGHSVAQGGQNSSRNLVLPVGVEADVLRVFEALLPGVSDEVEIAALRDGMSGSATGYLGAGPRAGWVLWWGRRRAGLRVEGELVDSTLRIRRGVLTRSLSVMPIVRAQSVQLRRPLVHRMMGLASIQAHTVLGPVRMEMRGLALRDAQEAFDALAATVLRVQKLDAAGPIQVERAGQAEQPEQPGPSHPAPEPAPSPWHDVQGDSNA